MEIFPTEVRTTYYIPYVPKRFSPTAKGIYAKGRLVDKVRNILFMSGDTIPMKKRRLEETGTEPHVHLDDDGNEVHILYFLGVTIHCFVSEIKDAVTFLKHCTEPWPDVLEKWKITTQYRQRNKKETLHEFINEWPILKDIRADQLVSILKHGISLEFKFMLFMFTYCPIFYVSRYS